MIGLPLLTKMKLRVFNLPFESINSTIYFYFYRMLTEETDLINLSAKFVNSTASHVFLTGKAGTGKTTFLHNLAAKTHKEFIIIAPTGIAALNAGGVTIHSQFLFPFGSYIPERGVNDIAGFFNQNTLARKNPLNSIRKQVLRAADLIIIDEVSMLRADILDAIDYRMRSVKGNFNRSFGGAQVLMIGDLYQLPPIVKDHEWNVLSKYYGSMHFFEALALKEEGFVYIELDKIFRQQDGQFINILNNLRNNLTTKEDIEVLNSHFKTEKEIDQEKEIITLTTHNYKADEINLKKLGDLTGKASNFKAKIKGDFPEKLYPILENIGLKVGAQIMFIKNDSSPEKIYFNGKLAMVIEIEKEEVTVRLADSNVEYVLQKDEWENKKYSINDQSKELEEDVVGTFIQYPVKLAWAVTVHKSQGLTFDRAIIDVGQAFASGQVYVALSRLRSLEGLILRTKINTNSLGSDKSVVDFTQTKTQQKPLPEILQNQQNGFLHRLLSTTFEFSDIEKQIAYIQHGKKTKMEFEIESMRTALSIIDGNFRKEKENTQKFRNQLLSLLSNGEKDALLKRIEKGSTYYLKFLEENQKLLLLHLAEVEQYTRTKTYINGLDEIDQLLMKSLGEIEKSATITHCILSGNEIRKSDFDNQKRTERHKKNADEALKLAKQNPELASTKTGRKKTTRKSSTEPNKPKVDTFKVTFDLVAEGKSIAEICKERGLVKTTIEGHIAKGIALGNISISKFLPKGTIDILTLSITKSDKGSKEIYEAFKGKYSYGQIRMVQASLAKGE